MEFSANRDQGRSIGGITFAHTASTLTVSFSFGASSLLGGSTESWGLDNIVILDNNVAPSSGVPEPSTIALAATALAALALKPRRK